MLILAACLTLMVCSFSAELTEATDRGSHNIPLFNQQFFSTSNSTTVAEMENSALASLSCNVFIDLADEVSHFFHRYTTHIASTLYPSECLMDFLSLFSSKGDISKGYKNVRLTRPVYSRRKLPHIWQFFCTTLQAIL